MLWQAVKNTLQYEEDSLVIIYTGDVDADDKTILRNVKKRFDLELDETRLRWVFLQGRKWVDSKTWPRFTLLGQALGSAVLCYEAINCTESLDVAPDVWIDTMGYPFSYPLVWLMLGVPIIAYVHFPVISKDMLNKLTLSASVSGLKQLLKFVYWYCFLMVYTFVGFFVDITLTNSTWTNNHIQSIWWLNDDIEILYPPCSTEKFIDVEKFNTKQEVWDRENRIVVLAQFRPEKRHDLIIKQYAKFIKSLEKQEELDQAPKLTLIGSIRNAQDRKYVQELQTLATDLSVPSTHIEFSLDLPYDQVLYHLRHSSYGLNAMWNEHFGIAVVEYVANGLIPLVHASAGPYLDIVVPWDMQKQRKAELDDTTRTGFYFRDVSDPDYDQEAMQGKFADLSEVLMECTQLADEEKLSMTRRGQDSVLERFSDLRFDNEWNEALYKVNLVKKHGSRLNKNWLGWIAVATLGLGLARFL